MEKHKWITHCTSKDCPLESTCYRKQKRKTLTDSNFDFTVKGCVEFVEIPNG